MRPFIISACLFILAITANAQTNYDVSLIPKELLPYASAVVRNEEVSYEVKDLDNVIYHLKKAITVLNKNGDDIAHIVIEHDKFNFIRNIKGVYFDQFGKQIGKFSESDFDDVSVSDGVSLFNDDRIKHYIPSVTTYPYTIEYEYELRSKQSLTFDDWEPVSEPGVSVEKSSYIFSCKPDFAIRYKEMNMPDKAVIATNKTGMKTYTWNVQNKRATRQEPFSPEKTKYLSIVKIAPEKFTFEGISGQFTNWPELGKWMYDKLLADRDALPTETVEHIKELTAGITDPKLKAKKIYEYMQQKTHYISVQVGIGGWQPFLASDVDKLNYGDCKALVNYTKALLKAVDIDSWYCVVNAGSAQKLNMLNDFASLQGNHIILCLPFKNDTTWCDCTSQTIPFGFLGDFTDDRTVLACTPQGGKLLHTPKYTYDENLERFTGRFKIDEEGSLSGNMENAFKGTDYDNRDWIIEMAPADRVKEIKNHVYPINNLEINKLEYKQDKTAKPVTTENITLSAREYASVTDDKISFMLNSINRRFERLRQVRNRVNEVDINRGYTEEDEITYILPKNYRLDTEPLYVTLDRPYGSFTATLTVTGDQLLYKRKLQLRDGIYSKDKYQDLADFFESVYDADNYSVTLLKNKAN